MLQRAIYVSDAVGTAGGSILSIAQILGVSDANNRRDHLTGALILHQGQFMQVIEGARSDLDRLLKRLNDDPRHTNLRLLTNGPAGSQRFGVHPMTRINVCADMEAILADRPLSALALPDAEALLLASRKQFDIAV